MYKEIEGNLITLAKEGAFDVIAHGCNCFCRMKRGIAPQMAEAFYCNMGENDWFPLENKRYEGDINKLGQIDYETFFIFQYQNKVNVVYNHKLSIIDNYENPKVYGIEGTKIVKRSLSVVNAYTQYHWDSNSKPFDYEAFTLCCRKMNKIFRAKHIGLPKIGSHLAGGDWEQIKSIIQAELKACDVTIVIFKP